MNLHSILFQRLAIAFSDNSGYIIKPTRKKTFFFICPDLTYECIAKSTSHDYESEKTMKDFSKVYAPLSVFLEIMN